MLAELAHTRGEGIPSWERQRLADVVDLLNNLLWVTLKANAAEGAEVPPPPQPLPRPWLTGKTDREPELEPVKPDPTQSLRDLLGSSVTYVKE